VDAARRGSVGRARESFGFGGVAILAGGFKGSESASAWRDLSAVECGCMGIVAVEPSVGGGAAASGPSDSMAGRCN
jgi:hypothetical protein